MLCCWKGRQPDKIKSKKYLHYLITTEYNEHEEPYNLAQQTGAFEVIRAEGEGQFMRQMVTQIPIYWCASERLNMAVNLLGSQKWYDIHDMTWVDIYI